ncbi:MAG: GGDEF domain-containing protein, partial [Allorhizobium sp.]
MDRVIKNPVRGNRDTNPHMHSGSTADSAWSDGSNYSPPAVDAKTITLPALNALYQTHRSFTQLRQTRQGLWLAALVYLLFGVADAFLLPDVAVQTVTARLIAAILAISVMEVCVARRVGLHWVDLSCAATVVVGYVAWLIPATYTTAEDAFRYYMLFGTIFMMSANLFFNLVFRLSVLTSATILVIFLYSMLHAPALSLEQTVVVVLFYASCFLFTSYVNWKLNEERYNVFLNAVEAAHQHSEAEKRGEALERLSNTDYLTGMENRRAVDKRLRDYWNDWQSEGKAFAAILVDVD